MTQYQYPFTGKFAVVFKELNEENRNALIEHLTNGTSANVISRIFETVDIKLSPTTIKEQRTRLLDSLESDDS